MCWRFRAFVGAVLTLVWLAGPVWAQSRGVTVDDVVGLEAFGRASISPNGRWAVYEKRGRYDSAPRFDFGQRNGWLITDLWRVDLRHPDAPPRKLLPGEGPGLLRGAWSPSGDRILVTRFDGTRLEVGIASLADRSVRWTGLTPEMPPMGAASQWISDDRVLILAREEASLPWLLRYYGAGQTVTSEAWRRTAAGQVAARTVVDTDGRVATAEGEASRQMLLSVDVRTGEKRALFTGRIVDFSASPDGDRIALIEAEAPRPMPRGRLSQSETLWVQRFRILGGRTGEPLAAPVDFEPAPHLLRWSRDSRRLLVWGRANDQTWGEGDLRIVSRNGRITVVDRHGLEPMSAGREIDSLTGVRADWLGSTPVILAAPDEGRRDWYALPKRSAPRALTSGLASVPEQLDVVHGDAAAVIADGGLWRLDRRGRQVVAGASAGLKPAAVYDPEAAFRLRINDPPARDWILAQAADGGLVVARGADSVRLGSGDEGAVELLAGSSSTALALTRSGLSQSLLLLQPGRTQRVDQVNADFADVDLPQAAPLDHLDAFGHPVRSWLFLPPSPPENVKGVIILVYPGSTNRGAWSGPLSLAYGLRPALLVGAGYAVLSPAIPGSDFGDDAASVFTRSVDLAFDATVAAHPELPAQRTAVVGHSFGGYAALAIATRSRRYQTYVAWAASSDLFGLWGEFTPANRTHPEEGFMMLNQQGWAEVGQTRLGVAPFDAPARYAAASPFVAADRIAAPVLLITSDRDFVPQSQAERIFSALSRTGGRARLVTYAGEEHFNWSPANIRDLYGQVFDWLDLTLGGPSVTSPVARDPPTP